MFGFAGSEARISDCRHAGWEVTNCVHSEDVGVKCGAPDHQPNQPNRESNAKQKNNMHCF
jgi:hypothetical protein